jgi:hypothetical protein
VLLDGVQTSVERFLAALGAHDMIRVCGLLDGVSQTWIAFAERVEPLDPQAGNGQKNRIRGRITAIDSGAPRIDLRLYQVLIGGRALVNGAPLSLQVDTGGAKIAFVPRYGRHGGHLDPSALTAGMFVEVDWHGLVPQPSVAAHKIGIRAAGQFEPLYRVAGRVERVDLTANALVLRKADGGRFWFGAESYPQIAVGMAADAILVEDRSGHATELELGQVEIGAAVSVLARRRSDADLTALLAVVDR